MISRRLMEATEIKQCHSCATELPACDNFCRRCGILQRASSLPAFDNTGWAERETRALWGGEAADQMLSGPLVNALTRGIAEKTAPVNLNPFGARLVLAIVAVPIWLLIILLSPLDAYAAARASTSRMHQQRAER